MRLGFSGSILGRAGLRSHDGRRWQNHPHLSISLAYLRDTLLYLGSQQITMYRLSSDLAPYLTHPDLPQFHHQIESCEAELAMIGALARELNIRLSFHAPAHVLLNTPDPQRRQRAIATLQGLTALLDGMQQAQDAVIVVHVGGHYQQPRAALETFVRVVVTLPETIRHRLALEHDDRQFSVDDVLWVHERTGIRLIFDYLHHRLNNPRGIDGPTALAICLATWPPGQTPKIHFSTPATEMVRDRKGRPHPPRLNRHSHYINPFVFIDFMRSLPATRAFDVMLEAKARDLAVMQLRRHLTRFAPELLAQEQ